MADTVMKTHTKIKWILYAIISLTCIGIIILTYWYFFTRNVVFSDDARLDADMVDIAPQISGNLIAAYVIEGDHIKKGQKLFELDSTLLKANLTKAENDLNSANKSFIISETAYIKALNGPKKEEILMAEAEERIADEKMKLAGIEWERVKNLFQDKSVNESDRDKAKTDYENARDNYESAKENLKLFQKGTREEDKKIAKGTMELNKAQIASFETMVEQAKINLDYSTVFAPFDGVIVRQWRKPGSVISQGTMVYTALNTSTFYVSANIEEKYVHRVLPGDKVDITIDSYPGIHLKGKVDKVLRAANSEFSLIPSEGVSGTYIKVTQRVPLRINLENSNDITSLNLGPGFSVVVHIHTNTFKHRKH